MLGANIDPAKTQALVQKTYAVVQQAQRYKTMVFLGLVGLALGFLLALHLYRRWKRGRLIQSRAVVGKGL